ncbi:YqhG family protein [Paenibacillus thermotolerans]|uniref:YqhG family protein n=1 Tax=Paenibacillus thermotolerans TaxID=3027807 RepID=UPI002367C249|nr:MULTISPECIES: YqhG family protein [unclassified Paenibacillus]
MNAKQIHKFVSRYVEATQSHIVEKSPAHLTVKLSPEADRDLTNRSYYWTFVERTGAEPQTMTMTFVFDPDKAPATLKAQAGPPRPQAPAPAPAPGPGAPSNPQGDSILGRFFGFAPAPPSVGRTPYDEVTYGSRRLNQLFGVVRNKGRYVQMYEDVKAGKGAPYMYETWLAVNYKVEFCCDMKRDELHSLGISLLSGEIVDDFFERLDSVSLTPKLPSNTMVLRPTWSIPRAAAALEDFLEREVRSYNHGWAHEAQERLLDELARVDAYYGELLQSIEPDNRPAAEEQYESRKREIDWQYRPRIAASVVNAGVFHLGKDALSPK